MSTNFATSPTEGTEYRVRLRFDTFPGDVVVARSPEEAVSRWRESPAGCQAGEGTMVLVWLRSEGMGLFGDGPPEEAPTYRLTGGTFRLFDRPQNPALV